MQSEVSRVRLRSRGIVPGLLVLCLLVSGASPRVAAQTHLPPEKGGFTRSLGIPSSIRFNTGFETQWYRPSRSGSKVEALANLGVSRYLGSPTVGAAALGVEGYLGARGDQFTGGARAHFFIPAMQFGLGADWDLDEDEVDLTLRFDLPIRRSGIVGHGSTVSVRYLPTRSHTFGIGMTFLLGDRDIGQTRPQRDAVEMDVRHPERVERGELGARAADLDSIIGVLRERVQWVTRWTQPFVDESGSDARQAVQGDIDLLRAQAVSTDARFPNGHTANEEIRVYHELLVEAFSSAASPAAMRAGTTSVEGERIGRVARRLLLDDVVFPYNALFGQLKENDSLYGLIAVAQTEFARWLLTESGVDGDRLISVFYVFESLCDILDETRAELSRRWQDNRQVWLPLQLGLRPDEHDSQEEINDILERATGQQFTAGNRFWYIINEEFQFELARSVRLAEDYHVLWIHDVSGVDHDGDPDYIAYEQVLNYLVALTERVERYDDVGKLPMYFIFLDQHFFQANRGALWMRLLESPLDHTISLPSGFREWQQNLEDQQAKLRQAVDNSLMLRLEESQYGEAWLKNRIKVHVNITNPADPSYFAYHVVGILPVPDNHMRDHRKIIFYDVTEDDPYRGLALFTGMGVGEHYVGSDWEDRAVMIQGPAALATKDAARALLRVQGFEEGEIPFPLRSRPLAPDYQEKVQARVAALPSELRDGNGILQVHNGTGFTPKPASVAKAVLYTLMPPGSMLRIPDSLWQSYSFASLLAGSALRGCRVMIIAPTLKSAPSAGSLQMSRAHGLMSRLVVFGEAMDDLMEKEGGLLKVGLYAPRQGVGDIGGRIEQAVDLQVSWRDRVSPTNPATVDVARRASAILDSIGYHPVYLDAKDSLSTPKLHLKTNYLTSGVAWDKLMGQPEWAGILYDYILYLADQQGLSGETHDVRRIPAALQERVRAFLTRFVGGLTSAERNGMILYLTAGSMNMDYRSQMMNGEVMIVMSGAASLSGSLDFVLLTGLCEWMQTTQDVDALLPPPSWRTRKLADFVKIAL